jgi:hypothetical protein
MMMMIVLTWKINLTVGCVLVLLLVVFSIRYCDKFESFISTTENELQVQYSIPHACNYNTNTTTCYRRIATVVTTKPVSITTMSSILSLSLHLLTVRVHCRLEGMRTDGQCVHCLYFLGTT